VTEEHTTSTDESVGQGGLGDLGLAQHHPRGHRLEKRRRGSLGCVVVIVVMALVVAGLYFGLTKGVDWAKDYFSDAEDYPGPGKGSVLIEVVPGDNATDIAHTLEEADVVASAEAFVDAANSRAEEAGRIQAGFYELKKQMKAEDALSILVDPSNVSTNTIAIPEGFRVVDIVDRLVEKTDFKRARFEKALADPDALGLPAYAKGNPEGYLFPATYAFAPNATPATMLKAMVDRWRQAADEAGLEEAAEKLGYTAEELMTVASLVEAEGRGADMPKIARVIYNRLENPGTAGTIGRLQIDASVNYGLNQKLGVTLTQEQRDFDTPYNTYLRTGLPPTPIEAPGDAAIAAAAHPADGDWYYYVTVNLRTGETKFAETYDEFLSYKNEYTEYCQTSKAC
jgi:UPF0755 protein